MKPYLLAVFAATTLLCCTDVYADVALLPRNQDDKAIWTAALENDYFAGEDNGYTNGVRFSYISPETDIPWWIDTAASHVPFFAEGGHKRYSFAVGQSMYAPDDLTQKGLILDDRPYAGYLYGSVGLLADKGYRLDNLQLTLGVVGESSLAAQTQNEWHKFGGFTDPQGWDNQLRDELGVVLTYERKWRALYEFSPFGLGADVSPFMGGSLGNVHTNLSTGATFRLGYDLPADYGPPLIQPSITGSDFFVPTNTIGWYVFAGFEGRAVARNIFLDGNTFKDSHSVDKENFVGGFQTGIAFTYMNTRLAYTHIFRTREFEQQNNPDEYGAVTLSYRF
jgi:lipid A 3-O-deacylase